MGTIIKPNEVPYYEPYQLPQFSVDGLHRCDVFGSRVRFVFFRESFTYTSDIERACRHGTLELDMRLETVAPAIRITTNALNQERVDSRLATAFNA